MTNQAMRRRPSVDELSARASRLVSRLVQGSRLPASIEADARLPLVRVPVRVSDRIPGAQDRSDARILLASREPGALAIIITDVANAASPAVSAYYRSGCEPLPREWHGRLALDTDGRLHIVAPSGSAVIIADDGIGFTSKPFARDRNEVASYARAMTAWQCEVLDAPAEAA